MADSGRRSRRGAYGDERDGAVHRARLRRRRRRALHASSRQAPAAAAIECKDDDEIGDEKRRIDVDGNDDNNDTKGSFGDVASCVDNDNNDGSET